MVKNYFKTALRYLNKNKTYTFLNVLGLSAGVVVCLLIAVWLQRELNFDNFHPNRDKIFRIANTFKSESETFSQAPSSMALGAQLPRLIPAVKAASRIFPYQYKFKSADVPFYESNTLVVDSNFFSFFGFRLKKGQAEEVLNSPNEVVLTEKMAVKYFGNTQNIIGKIIMMDDQAMTVSGVAENPPANSQIQFDILVPYVYLRNWALKEWKEDPDNVWVGGWPLTYVELAEPKKLKEAEKQINNTIAKFSEKRWKENKVSYTYFLQPIRDIHLNSNLRYDSANNGSLARVKIFSVIGVIVLSLACINYVNLTTAGAIKRAKEISVRKVIGAMQMQLVRQFFLETLIVCATAVFIGILVVKIILPSFSAWIAQPYYFPINFLNVLIILGFILAISVIAGIYPSKILSSFNPAVALKGNLSQGKIGNTIRKGLVVFQFTITIALTASIFIISQQMDFIRNKSLGFNGSAVLQINFNGDGNVVKHYASIRQELLRDPHILNVSKHNGNIVGGLSNGWTTTENLKGEELSTSIYNLYADADYWDTYGMKLIAGRFFSNDISTDSTKSVLINEAALKTFGWQKPENAIGKPFGKGEGRRYVIGVVKDFHFESLHKPVEAVLIGFAKSGSSISLKVDAAYINEAIDHLSQTWKSIVPEVPLQYSFVDQRISQQYGNEQKMESIFYVFSGLALLIACLGLFGLSTFVVERKFKEIGIRKVLGSSVSGIVALLSKDFLYLVLIAVLIASPLSWYFMNSWLEDFAYRISIQWWVFLFAGIIALLIALLTVSIQSVKAAVANPVKSLRSE